jgi:hypothetical protein
MRRHRLFSGVIGVFAVLAIIAGSCGILERMTIEATLTVDNAGEHHYAYSLGKPNLGMFPVLWRSGGVKKLLRTVMIGLSFLGGLRIGILLLNNREKLGGMRNHRLQRIGRDPLKGAAADRE